MCDEGHWKTGFLVQRAAIGIFRGRDGGVVEVFGFQFIGVNDDGVRFFGLHFKGGG